MAFQLTIGLFGFGCVGQGLYDVLQKSIRFKADIKKICVKNPDKKRALPEQFFTYNKWDILNDASVNLVVELIDDAGEAYHIVKTALKQGKHVVTANKKMVAQHLDELIRLQQQYNVSLLYEASSCGGIPIIRTLEEYYDNELLNGISGIFNGSSNFILSKIFNENLDYDNALLQAQQLGFAETDPILDVGGYDAKYKLCILTAHAYGLVVDPDSVFNYGIQHLGNADFELLRRLGYKLKLHPVARKTGTQSITLYVLPEIIGTDHELYAIEQEYNAVLVEAAFSDKQLFIGKGAGGHPTGSAVLSDISALTYQYKYEYKKTGSAGIIEYTTNVELPVYIRTSDKQIAGLFDLPGIQQYKTENGTIITGLIPLNLLIREKEYLESNGTVIAIAERKILEKLETYLAEQATVYA